MVGQRSPRSTLARLLVDVIATRAVAESLYGGEVVDAIDKSVVWGDL